jgi:hypothetical protein
MSGLASGRSSPPIKSGSSSENNLSTAILRG